MVTEALTQAKALLHLPIFRAHAVPHTTRRASARLSSALNALNSTLGRIVEIRDWHVIQGMLCFTSLLSAFD